MPAKSPRWTTLALITVCVLAQGCAHTPSLSWQALWATAPLAEDANPSLQAGGGVVVRQVVRVSQAAQALRLRLSNEYGREPLVLSAITVGVSAGGDRLAAGTEHAVTFLRAGVVTLPPGAIAASDPIAFAVSARQDLCVTLVLTSVPHKIAAHPGSRATSYVQAGGDPHADSLPSATRVVHWYFLAGIDGLTSGQGAVVCFGDSLTDGYGCKPDQNTRWTDALSARLLADPATAGESVLNLGIGGNRLLRDGLGPAGLSRLDRDVFRQAGARWVILELGINDLGTRVKARQAGQPFASREEIIEGYRKVIDACHAHSLKVGMATLTPFAMAKGYSSADIEEDRLALNAWIRSASGCDAVIDFDAALRDPAHPGEIPASLDSGDHLHPSIEGYRLMATAPPRAFLEHGR
jgi:lysophospholipase L1-like esterase